jgi:hypothetical protein
MQLSPASLYRFTVTDVPRTFWVELPYGRNVIYLDSSENCDNFFALNYEDPRVTTELFLRNCHDCSDNNKQYLRSCLLLIAEQQNKSLALDTRCRFRTLNTDI